MVKPTNLGEYTINTLKPPVPGSIPGTGFPEVKGFISNSHKISISSHRQINVCSFHSVFLPWAHRLANVVAGVRGSCDNGYRPANRKTYVGGAAHFSQSPSTLMSGDSGLT